MKREEVKRVISRAIIVGIAAVMSMSLFACKPKEKVEKIEIPLEKSVNSNETKAQESTKQITITPEEAARGKTVENTKRTVNEYGITIYGKEIGENAALSKGLVNKYDIKEDKEDGVTRIYTEYYSDAYGGIVFIKSNAKSGGIEIFNEKGDSFIAGKKPQNDIEVILANYRMGNAMAEAIDRSVKNNK